MAETRHDVGEREGEVEECAASPAQRRSAARVRPKTAGAAPSSSRPTINKDLPDRQELEVRNNNNNRTRKTKVYCSGINKSFPCSCTGSWLSLSSEIWPVASTVNSNICGSVALFKDCCDTAEHTPNGDKAGAQNPRLRNRHCILPPAGVSSSGSNSTFAQHRQ